MRDLLMRHLNIYIDVPLLYTYTMKNIHFNPATTTFYRRGKGSQINTVKDMKREILEIADDLSNDAITPQQAKAQLLRLFGVTISTVK